MSLEAESETGRRTDVSGRLEERHRRSDRDRRRVYIKAGGLLLLALVAGWVIGVGSTIVYIKNKKFPKGPRPENIGESIKERLGRAVSLSAAEKERLDNIIAPRMKEVDAIRRESIQAITRAFDLMNDEIDELLGAERSEKWEAAKRERYGDRYRSKEERHKEESKRARKPPPHP